MTSADPSLPLDGDGSQAAPAGGVVVYGSCVARDTYEFMGNTRRLAAYIARQSLISAFSPPATVEPTRTLDSPFQQRALIGDLTSSLLPTVRQHARTTGLLLMDLVDERHGVYRLDDGSWVTNSAELKRSGLLPEASHSRLIRFGSERHFELWTRAFDRLIIQLDRYDLRHKTVVIEAPFAARTIEGEALVPFAGVSADEWNARFERYYAHVRAAALPTLRIPDEHVFSTRVHKWQPDPYHYVDGAYRALVRALDARPEPGEGQVSPEGTTGA